MKELRYSLCPNCDACPEVVISEGAVTIGEEGNQVRLAADEWNVLLAAIKDGRLAPIAAEAGARAEDCGCGCGCEA